MTLKNSIIIRARTFAPRIFGSSIVAAAKTSQRVRGDFHAVEIADLINALIRRELDWLSGAISAQSPKASVENLSGEKAAQLATFSGWKEFSNILLAGLVVGEVLGMGDSAKQMDSNVRTLQVLTWWRRGGYYVVTGEETPDGHCRLQLALMALAVELDRGLTAGQISKIVRRHLQK